MSCGFPGCYSWAVYLQGLLSVAGELQGSFYATGQVPVSQRHPITLPSSQPVFVSASQGC